MAATSDYITSLTLQTLMGEKGVKVTLTVGDIITTSDLLKIISQRKLDDLIRRKALIYGKYRVPNVKPKYEHDSTPEGAGNNPFDKKPDPERDNNVNLKTLVQFDSGESLKNSQGNTVKPEDTLPEQGETTEFATKTEIQDVTQLQPEETVTATEDVEAAQGEWVQTEEPEVETVATINKRGKK